MPVWYGNCSAADSKIIQQKVYRGCNNHMFPSFLHPGYFLQQSQQHCERPTYPSHSLFQFLPLGRQYRSIRARSARPLNSFFPQAVKPSTPISPPHPPNLSSWIRNISTHTHSHLTGPLTSCCYFSLRTVPLEVLFMCNTVCMFPSSVSTCALDSLTSSLLLSVCCLLMHLMSSCTK